MARTTAAEKLAASLEAAHNVQIDGIVRSEGLSRVHLTRLVKTGFLSEIIRGWYYLQQPDPSSGSTAWYVNYWSFVRQYLEDRFGYEYCLRPEPSLWLHAGSTVIPGQLTVVRPDPGQMILQLPYGATIVIHQDRNNFPVTRATVNGIQVMPLPDALVRVQTSFFHTSASDAVICLRAIRDAGEVLRPLLDRNLGTAAGRIAGAFRHLGMLEQADRIISAMKAAGVAVHETDPFDESTPKLTVTGRPVSPYVARIEQMWSSMRQTVLGTFSAPPHQVTDVAGYLVQLDQVYALDAYHSLSIEGYQVTPELIARIRSGEWNPDVNSDDTESRNAFAAKGYLEAFRLVKADVSRVLDGAAAGELVRATHHNWHQALFSAEVQSGLLPAASLAGYRHNPVYIRNSRHVPLPDHAIPDAMGTLFDLLESEPDASVRAILGHFVFVFIHPYDDGNGRMARFLMNVMLASGGFPWTVIRQEDRSQYFAALESASVGGGIQPFSQFILDAVTRKPVS